MRVVTDSRFGSPEVNVSDAGVRQFAVVTPGPYRFRPMSAPTTSPSIKAHFFRFTDADDPGRFQVETAPIVATLARTTIALDLTVPLEHVPAGSTGAQALLEVRQRDRGASDEFTKQFSIEVTHVKAEPRPASHWRSS